MRILIVDDSAEIRSVTISFIERKLPGVEIVEASDGVEGLARAREGAYNLIITDYDMPRTNGIEFIKKVHAEIAAPPPMLLYSGNPGAEEELTNLAVPRAGFMPKPLNLEEFSFFLQTLK